MIQDANPPILTQVVNNSGNRIGPGLSSYTISASDNISGIKSISGMVISSGYWTNKTYTTKPLSCANSGSNFNCNVDFSKYDINEQYQIYYLTLTDRASNSISYYYIPSLSSTKFYTSSTTNISLPSVFGISGLTTDRDPPVIQSITYDPITISGCGFIKVRAKAYDSIAGFGNYPYINVLLAGPSYFSAGTGNQYNIFSLAFSQDTNEFSSIIFIKSSDENGIWRAFSLSSSDSIYNNGYYKYLPSISNSFYATSKDNSNWLISPLPIGSGVTKY
jgi:hypothetical protein